MARLVDQLRAAIRASGETPAEVSRRAGVARSQVTRLLNAERAPNSDTIERIAAALGLEVVIRPKRRKGARG